jgi:hypothetical protein
VIGGVEYAAVGAVASADHGAISGVDQLAGALLRLGGPLLPEAFAFAPGVLAAMAFSKNSCCCLRNL